MRKLLSFVLLLMLIAPPVWAQNVDPNFACEDTSASTTSYACNFEIAIGAYAKGQRYWFKATNANTGAATINYHSIGAKTIKKVQGGVTTDLVADDIRANQWVSLVYDGTNMQMLSQLGNVPAGSGTIASVWTDSAGDVSSLTAAAGDTLDAGSADASSPTTRSTSLPGTCTEGQHHQDMGSGGTETYICTASNTWIKLITTTDTVDLATLATTATTANAGDSATAFFPAGTLEVARGGTGLGSGTSGGVLAYTASGTLASSAALTANLPVIGGGSGVVPSVGTRSGNTTAFVTTTGTQTSGNCVQIDANGNHIASGAACGSGSGDISSVGDVTGGAAFDGTWGTLLTFNNAGGDGTIGYDGTQFNLSHPIASGSSATPNLSLVDANDAESPAPNTGQLTANLTTVTTDAQVSDVALLQLRGGAAVDAFRSVGNGVVTIGNAGTTGVTLMAEGFTNATGIEFAPGDALTNCSTFSATGGGIFYDDSEAKFKKCQDNTLTDLDTGGGGGITSLGAQTGGTQTLTGAVGVDITSATNDHSFVVDATELNDLIFGDDSDTQIQWTINQNTGTDPVIQFDGGTVNISTGTLQQAGVNVVTETGTQALTNKTLDGSATGNVVKLKGYIYLTHPHLCDGTNATIGTTATSINYGHGTFSNSVDQATNYCEYYFMVPEDIDTAVAIRGRLKVRLGGADTASQRYVLSSVSVVDSAVATASTLANAINVDFAGDASGASGDEETSAWTTLTSWAGALTAGQTWRIRLARDGDTSDASTVNSSEGGIVIEYGISQ